MELRKSGEDRAWGGANLGWNAFATSDPRGVAPIERVAQEYRRQASILKERGIPIYPAMQLNQIQELLTSGINPSLRAKYLSACSPWQFGLAFLPPKIAGRFGLSAAAAFPPPARNNEQVIGLLRRAKAENLDLEIQVRLRSVDGPGSSLDLIPFQIELMVGRRRFTWMFEMPCTTVMAGHFSARFKVELADPLLHDRISYLAPDLFKEAHVVGMKETPEELRNINGLISMRDLPAYCLAKYFGISHGLKITCLQVSGLGREGGMESSNAFSLSIYAIGSVLSGADWSWPELIRASIRDENTIYGEKRPGITGGQGQIISVLGGIQMINWWSGLFAESEAEVYSADSYAAFVVPANGLVRETVVNRMYLCQAGKEFLPGGIAVNPRLASDENSKWTRAWDDPWGRLLHGSKMASHWIYKRALETGDVQAVADMLNYYSDVRLALGARVNEWDEMAGRRPCKGVGYMDEHMRRLARSIREAGGGMMPAGGGSSGAINIVFFPDPSKARPTLQKEGIELFKEEEAGRIRASGGLLKGALPFEPSDETVAFSSGWERLGMKLPLGPRVLAANQATGEVVSLDQFEQETGIKLPDEVKSMPSALLRGDPAGLVEGNAALKALKPLSL